MKRQVRLWLFMGFGAGVWLCAAFPAPAQTNAIRLHPGMLTAELLARGRSVYANHCSGCHGENGKGLGPAAYGLFPKPRDFTSGTFKFRSTPQSALPTDEDLFRTVRQGVLGTSMPAFDLMPNHEVLGVVQYIKIFSDKWKDPSNYAPAIGIPNPPEWFRERSEFEPHAARGKEMFLQACAACHGETGAGNGPSAAALTDSWGQPISPADLRKPFVRGGRNITDVYKALVTGISGSPMPSFKEALSEEQLWNLVAYIAQLREQYSGSTIALAPTPTPVAPTAPNSTPAVEKPSIYE